MNKRQKKKHKKKIEKWLCKIIDEIDIEKKMEEVFCPIENRFEILDL